MSQKQIPLYADGAGTITADTSASGNTVPLRGTNGELAGSQVLGSELKSTGSLTLQGGPTVTTTASADNTQTEVCLDASGGAFTYTLPAVAGVAGRVYLLKRINSGANLPTVKGAGTENIDGANTYTGLSAQYKAVQVYANGVTLKWDIVGAF